MPDAVVDLFCFLNTLEKRHYTGAEFTEKPVACLHVETFFELIETVIVRIHIRIDVFREFLLISEQLLEIRAEHIEIGGILCSGPYILSLYHKLLIGYILVHRDLLHVADVFEQQIYHALLIRAEIIPVRIEELKKLCCLFGCALPVDLLREDRHCNRSVISCFLRGSRASVIINEAHCMLISCHFTLQCHELCAGFIKSYVCHKNNTSGN